MSTPILKLKDDAITYWEDDHHYSPGCPTCDYGSEYCTEIDIGFESGKRIHIEQTQSYEYGLSQADMMRIMCSNYNDIVKMTRDEFYDWIKAKVLEKYEDATVVMW